MHANIVFPLVLAATFFDGRGFAEYSVIRTWSIVKMHTSLEQHDIIWSKYASICRKL